MAGRPGFGKYFVSLTLISTVVDKEKIISIFYQKMKFAFSSSIATALDYFLYLLLVTYFLSPVPSNLISAGTGMLTNFFLQKRFIFELKRKVGMAFTLAIATSIIGIAISTLLIYLLNKYDFFQQHQYITKALVTGLVFFYNFYMKRFAFERRFF